MMNAVQVQSAGFPTSYPYATSMPLPSAILRPLQQPIYDTEVLPSTSTPTEIIFFQRQLGQSFAYNTSVTKTIADTNLQQPGQLANPLEFSLFSFVFEVEPGTSFTDFVAIYKTSAFTYLYTGNRVYLQIPLTRIPAGVAPEGFSALFQQSAATERTNIHNGVGHVSNVYKFTIGRSALRIRPTESFQAKVAWPTAAPTITGTAQGGSPAVTGVRLRVFLMGLSWTAL